MPICNGTYAECYMHVLGSRADYKKLVSVGSDEFIHQERVSHDEILLYMWLFLIMTSFYEIRESGIEEWLQVQHCSALLHSGRALTGGPSGAAAPSPVSSANGTVVRRAVETGMH